MRYNVTFEMMTGDTAWFVVNEKAIEEMRRALQDKDEYLDFGTGIVFVRAITHILIKKV